MSEWVSVAKACQALDKSDRTIRRWIEDGKLNSRKVGRKVEVLVEVADTKSANGGQTAAAEIARLKAELEQRDRQIADLQNDKRHLQEQLRNQTDALRREQQLHAYAVLPWWKKIGKRKALPAPGGVMDMEQDTDKES